MDEEVHEVYGAEIPEEPEMEDAPASAAVDMSHADEDAAKLQELEAIEGHRGGGRGVAGDASKGREGDGGCSSGRNRLKRHYLLNHRSREAMTAEPNGTAAREGEGDPLRMGRIGVRKRFRKARIGVLWDLEQCQLPAFGGAEILGKISQRMSSWGYNGEVEVVVIGDMKFIKPDVIKDFQEAGILFSNIHSEKGRTHVQLLSKMYAWLMHKDGPANTLFISKISEERCLILKYFSSRATSRYNLIQKSLASETIDFAEYFWDWSDFLDGPLRSYPKACCWGGNESEGINNNYYHRYKGGGSRLGRKKHYHRKPCVKACCWEGNENEDINNNYYQDKGGGRRLSRKKKRYHRMPSVKASLSLDSWEENNRDGKAKNYRYKPY